MIKADLCPSCGGSARSLRHRDANFSIWRCATCDLGYCDPLPDRAQLEEAYRDAYDGATRGYFAKVARKLARSRGRVRQLVAKLDRPAPGLNFLDIGCNGGFMVEAARQAGFQAFGLDPDPVSIAYAREHYPGAHFTHAFLEDYRARAGLDPSQRFDALYCSEVIEHAPEPNRFSAALADLAQPGAILFVTTPDLGHFSVPRDLARFEAYCPPDHCLYFTRTSLAKVLERHGFEILGFRWAFKPGIKVYARKRA